MKLKRLETLVVALFLVAGTVPFVAAGAAEVSTTYTFDACAEGWTTADGIPPGLAAWARTEPGRGGDGAAFSTGPYTDLQTVTLTSPAHAWGGGDATVDFFLAHDVEEEFDGDYYDYVTFQWSVNGGAFTEEQVWYGMNAAYPDYEAQSVTFTAPEGQLTVRFRLISDETFSSPTGGYEGAFVDDVKIPAARPAGADCGGGEPTPTPTETEPTPTPTPTPTETEEPPTGGRFDCTITGTAGADKLTGTTGSDVICGRGGNDRINGRGGNDILVGGSGKDVLLGGSGGDSLFGGRGNDRLRGSAGRDDLNGSAGNDRLKGGSGHDTCSGGGGNDRLDSCEG